MHRLVIIVILLAAYSAAVPLTTSGEQTLRRKVRLIGGEQTTIDQVPWVVALQFRTYYVCEGTIIRSNAVISVARCALSPAASSYTFRAGSSYYASGGDVIAATNVTIHEEFTHESDDYDFVLFMTNAFPLGNNVAVINLPSQGQSVTDGTLAITAGWAQTSEDGISAPVINKVEIPIVNQETCQATYSTRNVTSRMLCAGESGKGMCSDQGSPLVIDGVLIGMGSWSQGCGRPGFPALYARVPSMIDWILLNLSYN